MGVNPWNWHGVKNTLENNKYLHLLDVDDRTPCVLCGAIDTIRWSNDLLTTSNPQCAYEPECRKRRNSRG